MLILFLHGWQSIPGGVKPTYLKDHGHTVLNPALPDDDFTAALAIAQTEFDKHRPDIIVGSSRGGALAMNLEAGETPLVLLCPAWKQYGTAKTIRANSTILHSRADDVIPFADSEELVRNSRLPAYTLMETGNDHRLADPDSLEMMLEACRKSVEAPIIISRSFAEVISGFKSYMRNRLCGIVYAESNGQKKPRFEIGSGFVIEARGLYVLVTAGHVFERIARLHQDDRLIGVSLVVPSGPRSVAELSLYPEDLATAWYSLSSDFDIAFMCISPDLAQHLKTAGFWAVRRDLPDSLNATPAKRVLVGYGADGAHIHDEEVLFVVENNAVRPRIKSQLGAVPFKMVGLKDSASEDGVNFHAIPESEDVPTLAGLSGGIVIDVFVNQPIRNYAWVGVQSSQHTKVKDGREVVTKVKFTSSAAVAEMADKYASEILGEGCGAEG
ncbi:Alpha/beta hydrolase family protein [Anatilimnocola aggregata]|uniref:Alpha/beta hydrolase family protein n=1 Tax=Anatilimnocola aggregata TaxID=2528021 RepID=A0A517YH42_9BACT|nr:alpha/beta hydrolase [Anatilimnocola aggregata]QDU29565.1 Alpha/beta hydrolase family protein [Anatilimnocola aggregata]